MKKNRFAFNRLASIATLAFVAGCVQEAAPPLPTPTEAFFCCTRVAAVIRSAGAEDARGRAIGIPSTRRQS